MPTVKIQDSDGKEQMIIAPAVIGLGIARDTYTAKIVATTKEESDKVVRATIKYFVDNHLDIFVEEVNQMLQVAMYGVEKTMKGSKE